jgi:hypothetical protein
MHVDTKPNYIVKSLSTLIVFRNSLNTLYYALIMDKIRNMRYESLLNGMVNGKYYHGFVNFGSELNGCLINWSLHGSWIFFINGCWYL